jgi:hypothetical protein
MSLNLTMSDSAGREIFLWQTPTFITNMCLSYGDDGVPDGGMEGVRRRYICWVNGTLNGVYSDDEELSAAREAVKDHLLKITEVIEPQFSYI